MNQPAFFVIIVVVFRLTIKLQKRLNNKYCLDIQTIQCSVVRQELQLAMQVLYVIIHFEILN